MTTTPTTPNTTPNAFTPDAYSAGYAAAENARRGSGTRTAVMATVGVLVGAGIAAGLFLGLGGASQQPVTPTPAPAAAPTSHVTVGHRTVVVPSGQVTPAPKPAPTPATPTAAVETLQRELGQLNYYEGPITGTMNTQTVAAIKDLQRDAGLPQTGTMNAATQQALVTMLAQGNNQMNS
jgi:peptidoglycan hydrolase-like protein with peptidoglycan-binding domain